MTIDTVLARVTTSPSAAPVEVVTPIKPSEAIRLGCLESIPTTGDWYDWDDQDRLLACAMGALGLGWGDNPEERSTPEFEARLRDLDRAHFACPVGGCVVTRWQPEWKPPVTEVVMHLNDAHEWERERIADWLEGVGL